MKRVALPVETKVRELNGKVWLAATLARRGYKVALGELTNVKLNLDLIRPHIYIGDSAVPKKSRIELYSRLMHANVAVAVHDTEGGIIYSKEYYRGRLSTDVLPYVSCFLAWGNETRSIFEEVWPDGDVVLAVVGNPSFDLLSRRCRSFYATEQAEIEERFGKFVLVNTHFGFYNHFDKAKYIDPVLEKFPGLYEFKRELYHEFVKALHSLHQHRPDINFVIRPHPSERFDSYREEFRGAANVFVQHERSVHPWILAAQAVIHNGCTTGVEAALLEKPVIAYRPVKNEAWDVYLPNYVSDEAFSLAELHRKVDECCREERGITRDLPTDKKAILEDILHTLDGRSVERVADAFDRLDIDECVQIGKLDGLTRKRRFMSGIRRLFSRKEELRIAGKNDYAKQKFDDLTLEEIESLMSRYKVIDPGLAGVRVESLHDNSGLFWVYSE